jgi:hypothetical protein
MVERVDAMQSSLSMIVSSWTIRFIRVPLLEGLKKIDSNITYLVPSWIVEHS